MPGAYAHITLVNLLSTPARLESIPGFPVKAIPIIMHHFKFCELGSVGPDYPYLALGNKVENEWANTMHYTRTVEMIRAGVRHLRTIKGPAAEKGLAWLLGYAAHVVTDATIHPVVRIKVGPYQGNEAAHRTCEMHQDAYIFQRLDLGDVGLTEHIKTGIASCHAGTTDRIDDDIRALWSAMLQAVHPQEYGGRPPDIDAWHKGFEFVVDKIAEIGGHLFPFARHYAADSGYAYPAVGDIDLQYIKNLSTPDGPKDYDAIFDAAIENVGNMWRDVASAVLEWKGLVLAKADEWDLDEGWDSKKQLVFWGGVA